MYIFEKIILIIIEQVYCERINSIKKFILWCVEFGTN